VQPEGHISSQPSLPDAPALPSRARRWIALGARGNSATYMRYLATLVICFAALLAAGQGYTQAKRLSCWAGGYARDGWMASCNSELYGVFDVDAVWFNLEPEIAPAAAHAQVLALGESHLQNALSLADAGDWFADHGVSFYSLLLPTAQSGFGEMLIDKLHVKPAVLLLDADPYFTGKVGPYESILLADQKKALRQDMSLLAFQDFHEAFCAHLPMFCGLNFSYFRSRRTGEWIYPPPDVRAHMLWGAYAAPNDVNRFPVGIVPDDTSLYPGYLAAARRLVGKLQIPPACVVITNVPSEEQGPGVARYLAQQLGWTLIDPPRDRLATFDRSHLTPTSARRWTADYLAALEPTLRRCIPASKPAAADASGATHAN
jgi:hypothetical protein